MHNFISKGSDTGQLHHHVGTFGELTHRPVVCVCAASAQVRARACHHFLCCAPACGCACVHRSHGCFAARRLCLVSTSGPPHLLPSPEGPPTWSHTMVVPGNALDARVHKHMHTNAGCRCVCCPCLCLATPAVVSLHACVVHVCARARWDLARSVSASMFSWYSQQSYVRLKLSGTFEIRFCIFLREH